jgi:hypothetical protein
LLSEIGRSASVTRDGGTGWKDFSFLRYQSPLRSAFVVIDGNDNELNGTDSWKICNSAIDLTIKQTGGGKPIDPSKVISEADKLAADHFRKRVADYVLVSSLSVERFPVARIRLHGCSISPLKTRGVRFPIPAVLQQPLCDDVFDRHLKATKYQLVKVNTAGRTIHEAADKALEALNLLRGLWTLFATYKAWSMNLGGTMRGPIGVIHTGPIHTLHHPDGSVVEDIYWYDSNYVEDQKLFTPKNGWKQIEKNRRWTTSHVRQLTYWEDLAMLVVRYAAALDHDDLDVAFLQMWSVLEKITNTVGGRYDDTIRRATRIFSDRNVARETLGALRLRRNQYVHAARSGGDSDQIVYGVKHFVDPHLLILVRNDYGVQSLEEYGDCLDLTEDVEMLERQRRHLNRALRIAKKRK